jgi:hypothetical protein
MPAIIANPIRQTEMMSPNTPDIDANFASLLAGLKGEDENGAPLFSDIEKLDNEAISLEFDSAFPRLNVENVYASLPKEAVETFKAICDSLE